MRRTRRSAVFMGATVLLTSAAWVGFTSGPTYADAPSEQGWWSAASIGSAPGGVSLPAAAPAAPATPAPPDVPADGLLVEGGAQATSPTAYAAVVYSLADGSTVSTLTLPVAPNTGTTPAATLQVCNLTTASITAEQGGPMSDAPAYDSSHCKSAGPSSDGKSYQFDVSSLATSGVVAVAVLPTAPTDRVVFSKPGADSLKVATPPAAASSDTGTGAVPTDSSLNSAASAAGGVPADQGAVTPSSTGSVTPDLGATAVNPVSSTNTPSLGALGSTAPAAASSSPAASGGSQLAGAVPASVSSGGGGAKPLPVILAIAGVLLALGLWIGAGRSASLAAAGAAGPGAGNDGASRSGE